MTATTAAGQVRIANRRGLHARAAAKFVQLAESFDAGITVCKDGMSMAEEGVCGTSIMGLMLLAASSGSLLHISASGAQAGEAVAALSALVESRFGEE